MKLGFLTCRYSAVTSYSISYRGRDDEEHYFINSLTGSRIFPGNTNKSAVRHHLTPSVAFHVRLYPVTWINAISLRWNLVFCIREFKTRVVTSQNRGTAGGWL